MRVLFLGNGSVALDVVRQMRASGAEVAGVVLHPPEMSRGRDEIRAAAGNRVALFEADSLRAAETLERIASLGCDLAVSAYFGFILRPAFIDLFPQGVINLHPAYLPWNRGGYPNVWSIVEGTPAGATLHYIDAGVDTGELIAREQVAVEPWDTGESLYRKLETASLRVFSAAWPSVLDGSVKCTRQPADAGSVHRDRDVEAIDRIDLDRTYSGRELIDLLRARTFPPHEGAYFETDGGRRVFLRLALTPETGDRER